MKVEIRWGRCLVTVFMYLSVNKVAFVVIRSESAIVVPVSQFITMLVIGPVIGGQKWLICFKVWMFKTSDKIDKLLLNYSNLLSGPLFIWTQHTIIIIIDIMNYIWKLQLNIKHLQTLGWIVISRSLWKWPIISKVLNTSLISHLTTHNTCIHAHTHAQMHAHAHTYTACTYTLISKMRHAHYAP